jgi:hypothetical protein
MKRFYDFNVWSQRIEVEKIKYMAWWNARRIGSGAISTRMLAERWESSV